MLSLEFLAKGVPWVEIWGVSYSTAMDLRRPEVQRSLLWRIDARVFGFVHLSLPGGTFSKARSPVLRSAQHPLGTPWVTYPKDRERIREDNFLYLFALQILELCASMEILFCFELPASNFFAKVPLFQDFLHKNGSV